MPYRRGAFASPISCAPYRMRRFAEPRRFLQLRARHLRRKRRGAAAPLRPQRLILLLHVIVAFPVFVEGPEGADAEDQAASEDDLDVIGDGQPGEDRVQDHREKSLRFRA
eukprot:CAMPEP_0119062090 /NCGR_PEP_ID=MMETSP1178-20130426/5765_1 /TAXON_ID=33656 /ORGANISM="unid sp, Strain CCMP2000" /LENGTH=109 /DNA_ID=CAMNT_0007043343 /DNA_START=262 /DNA_END=588 /DNA_ORIENTATION=+